MSDNYYRVNVKPGQRFGKLVVLREESPFVQPSGQRQRGFLCRCDCGNVKKIRLSHLRTGRVISCNCDAHGDVGKRLHNIWRGMISRTHKSHTESHIYFDKGIGVVKEWRDSYKIFREWALKNGYKEDKKITIDRIDGNKGYQPDNCRFVTQYVNNCNKNNTVYVYYDGEKRSLHMLLREKGLLRHYGAIVSRIKRGWEHNKAIDTPIRKGNYYTGLTYQKKSKKRQSDRKSQITG